MKKLFEIVWCFIDKNGEILRDEWDSEIVHIAYIKADTIEEAEIKWQERQNLRTGSAEIIEINTFVQV